MKQFFFCYTKIMRRFFIFGVVVFLLLTVNFPVLAQTRTATCDLCGFCPPNPPPSNWENCRQCLYESASSDPNSYETLSVGDENIPPTPIPGRWYTMIGCINTNLNSFENEGAAASVVQILLRLIFSTAGGIAFLYFLYGSFLILTSQADPERLNQGKSIVYQAIVGLIFSLSSIFIINLIGSGILKIPGFNNSP